jgi:hypothetical protein
MKEKVQKSNKESDRDILQSARRDAIWVYTIHDQCSEA